MAEDFYITGRFIGRRRLSRMTVAWARQARPRVLQPPRFETTAEGYLAHIFAEGGIRGFLVYHHGRAWRWKSRTRVTLNAMASRADWCSCYSFLRMMINDLGGTVVRTDGAHLTALDITAVNAELEARDSLCRNAETLRDFAENDKVAALCLPNPHYDLNIPVASFPTEGDPAKVAVALERMLIPIAARYQSAHMASTLAVAGQQTLAAWPLTATIVTTVDAIVIPEGDRMKVLDLERAIDILGRRVELVQSEPQRWYFPTLNLQIEENQMLYDRLLRTATYL